MTALSQRGVNLAVALKMAENGMDMYSGYYSDRSTQGAPFNGAPFGIDFNLSSSFACRQFFGSGFTDTAVVRNHHGNEEKNINNASTSLQTNNPHTVSLGTIAA